MPNTKRGQRGREVIDRIVDLLESGYVLTSTDFREIYERNGLRASNAGNIVACMGLGQFTRETGVPLVIEKVQGQILWRDGRLPEEDTDLQNVRREVAERRSDQKWRRRHEQEGC